MVLWLVRTHDPDTKCSDDVSSKRKRIEMIKRRGVTHAQKLSGNATLSVRVRDVSDVMHEQVCTSATKRTRMREDGSVGVYLLRSCCLAQHCVVRMR